MLRLALNGVPVIAAHGPIYDTDPAGDVLAPFIRSATESGWPISDEGMLVPDHVLERVRRMRTEALDVERFESAHDDLVDWARAGLVLEVSRRHGIVAMGRGTLRPSWKLCGTVTGRFGVDPVRGPGWTFNPHSLGPDDRRRIRPSDHTRMIAVLDFRGMDVCSMISIVPGLSDVFSGHPDPHQRTADLTGLARENAKAGFLSWAYGASFAASPLVGRTFDESFPQVRDFTRGMEHGDFPRMVQMTSALAFRAALSRALPMLVGNNHVPMFTVHDELVLDCSEIGLDSIGQLVHILESGASDRIGVSYRVGVSTGYTYEEAKSVH